MNAKIKETGLTQAIKNVAGVERFVLNAAAKGLRRGLEYAVTIARREFLSGPRPARLDIVTGRLRGAMSYSVDPPTDRGVVGRFGNNVAYAAYHEFGFRGTMQVRAHTRVMQQLNAAGAAIDTRHFLRRSDGDARPTQSRKEGARKQQSGTVVVQFVKAHSREVNYAGRPFARPALTKARPFIVRAIVAELRNGARGAARPT